MKKKKKKEKYVIPCKKVGNKGANDYKIIFSIDYKKIKKNEEYFVDYHLLIYFYHLKTNFVESIILYIQLKPINLLYK